MKWLGAVLGYAVAAGLVAGCGVRIDVCNRTTFGITAHVAQGGGRAETRSPTFKYCSSVDASEGPFSITVERTEAWIGWARDRREVLVKMLENPTTMSPSQVKDLQDVLAQLNRRMARFDKANARTSCTGTIGKDEYIVAVVFRAPDDSLLLECEHKSFKSEAPGPYEQP